MGNSTSDVLDDFGGYSALPHTDYSEEFISFIEKDKITTVKSPLPSQQKLINEFGRRFNDLFLKIPKDFEDLRGKLMMVRREVILGRKTSVLEYESIIRQGIEKLKVVDQLLEEYVNKNEKKVK
jgi:hypothetical protein